MKEWDILDKCEYTATITGDLKQHSKIKLEGLRYSCDKCECTETTARCLKLHIEAKHEGLRYPCDKCEYSASSLVVSSDGHFFNDGKKEVLSFRFSFLKRKTEKRKSRRRFKFFKFFKFSFRFQKRNENLKQKLY